MIYSLVVFKIQNSNTPTTLVFTWCPEHPKSGLGFCPL